MTKSEAMILEAKSPEDYIDRSLKARLAPSAKAKLARLWMQATGYTKEDILKARNRHPYWKRKKMEGSAERTKRRLAEHNYSSGTTVHWDVPLVQEFLDLNQRGADGRYENKDWQLAERFGATIPSIQYMRRKLSKVELMLGSRAPRNKIIDYLLHAESVLARGKGAIEELKNSRSKKAAVGASKSRGNGKARPAAGRPKKEIAGSRTKSAAAGRKTGTEVSKRGRPKSGNSGKSLAAKATARRVPKPAPKSALKGKAKVPAGRNAGRRSQPARKAG